MSALEFGLTYTPAQERFRVIVKGWLSDNVPADISLRPQSDEESLQLYRRRRTLGSRLGERGWLYPGAPAEYGGGGLDRDSVIVLQEEMHAYDLSLPPYYDSGGQFGSATIRVWGTDDQKAALLPPIYRGDVRTWQLLSEPGAGSDLASVSTTAIRDGDDYVLNGQKIFVGSNHGADRLWLIAVTDPGGERHKNLSWFMIDAGLPGIEIQPQYLLAATGEGTLDTGHKNTVYFQDVRVPASSRVGPENEGWKVAATHLELEHGASAGLRPNPIWSSLLTYCQETIRDGRPLIADSSVQVKLAHIYSRLEAVRILAIRNTWMTNEGMPQSYEGPQVSYIGKTAGLWLTKEILDIIGPGALTDDAIWGAMGGLAEAQQRDGIVGTHPGGTTDIERLIISRRLGLGQRTLKERTLSAVAGNNHRL